MTIKNFAHENAPIKPSMDTPFAGFLVLIRIFSFLIFSFFYILLHLIFSTKHTATDLRSREGWTSNDCCLFRDCKKIKNDPSKDRWMLKEISLLFSFEFFLFLFVCDWLAGLPFHTAEKLRMRIYIAIYIYVMEWMNIAILWYTFFILHQL